MSQWEPSGLALLRDLLADEDVAKRFGLGSNGHNGQGNGHRRLSAAQWRKADRAIEAWLKALSRSGRVFPVRAYRSGVIQMGRFLAHAGVRVPELRADRATLAWLDRFTENEIAGAMTRYSDQIKSAMLYGLRTEANPVQTASWLYHATKDAREDWRLIARTETARANALGRLDGARQAGYEQVWVPPHAGACRDCHSMLFGEVFDVQALRTASNYNRKRTEWVPAVPLHPRCRCTLLPYLAAIYEGAQAEHARLSEMGLDDAALEEMFDSSGQLKARYRGDGQLAAFKGADPYAVCLERAVEKARTANVIKGFFDAPALDLDPLIFEGHRLKPAVTRTLTSWWASVGGSSVREWSALFLTGGETGLEWGGRHIEHDPDLDLQIILDYDGYRAAHPDAERLDDLAIHALLVARIKAAKQGVEAAPGLALDAFIRPERDVAQFLADVRMVGQAAWDVYGERWAIEPPGVPNVSTWANGHALEGLGGTLAATHPEWAALGEQVARALRGLYDDFRAKPSAEGKERLQRMYTWLHDQRKASYESPEGERGLGQFLWQYAVNFAPLERVKAILSDEPVGKAYDPAQARDREGKWAAQGFRAARPRDLRKLKEEHGHTFGAGYGHVHVPIVPGNMVARAINLNTGHDKRFYSRTHEGAQAAKKYGRVRALQHKMNAFDRGLAERARHDDTAAALLLVRHHGLRPGSDARRSGREGTPDTFGASNLRVHHVQTDAEHPHLRFTGKSGKPLDLEITHPSAARELRRRVVGRRPDERLFDTDERRMLRHVREHLDSAVKTKDLRTYHATDLARAMKRSMPSPKTAREAAKARQHIAKHVSAKLGNTPAMALKSYIDPDVFRDWPRWSSETASESR